MAMARVRHSLVAQLSRGGDLLDVACGSGYALPQIARHAASVTAADRDPENIRDARGALPSGSFLVADAESHPFPEDSYDVVACLEAIYYFRDWRRFLRCATRLLRPGGAVVVSWPNPSRPAFCPSPGSTTYPTVDEMFSAATEAGLNARIYGAFPLGELATARRPWLDAVRRAAVRLHLVPDSLRLRMAVKRLIYRRMRPLTELDLLPEVFDHLVELAPAGAADYAMLYLVGRRPIGAGR